MIILISFYKINYGIKNQAYVLSIENTDRDFVLFVSVIMGLWAHTE